MLRVLYAGSPSASALTLQNLIEKSTNCGFEIVGVLTNPPSSQGRHKTLVKTPVALVAENYKIPVFEPEHLDSVVRDEVSVLNPDIFVCFAYGHLFGPKFMGLFKFGGINLHPSALPKYRGCTPVNASILNRDKTTAFTIQKVSAKMDEGNILAQKVIELTYKETSVSLLNDAAVCGADLLCDVLFDVSKNNAIAQGCNQSGEPSYTGMITKQDAKIDWNVDSFKIDAIVRAYYEDPCSWTEENGLPLKIWEGEPLAETDSLITSELLDKKPGSVCLFVKSMGIIVRCGSGFYAIKKLQRQGKNAMDYKAFINGAKDFVGSILG